VLAFLVVVAFVRPAVFFAGAAFFADFLAGADLFADFLAGAAFFVAGVDLARPDFAFSTL
jgi:hypothetical protein